MSNTDDPGRCCFCGRSFSARGLSEHIYAYDFGFDFITRRLCVQCATAGGPFGRAHKARTAKARRER